MAYGKPADPLLHPDVAVRWTAAGTLGASTDPDAVARAVLALGDVDSRVRVAGAESLAELSARGLTEAAAIPLLAATLEDPSPEARSASARALAAMAAQGTMSPLAIGPLAGALDDPHAATRRWATAALGHLGRLGPSARRTVWAALSNRALADVDGEVKRQAAESLAALAQVSAPPPPDRASELRRHLGDLPLDQTVERLVQLGRRLAGAPLRRSSWTLVARALIDPHAGDVVLRILAAATSREHALRALRVARTARVNRGPKPRAAGARAAAETVRAQVADHDQDVYDDDDDYPESSFDPTLLGVLWRESPRLPGVLAVSAVQAAADDVLDRTLSWERPRAFTGLRARIDDATFARLTRLVGGTGAPRVDAEIAALAERLGVRERAEHIAFGPRPSLASPAEVALLCALEEQRGQGIDAEVDWSAVTGSLIERLSRPPPEDEAVLAGLLRAFLRALTRAPRAQAVPLLRSLRSSHREYSPLALWAQLRAAADVPAAAAVARMAVGSALAVHQARMSLEDLRAARRIELPLDWPWLRQEGLLPELLVAGAGSLRRMDYPSFRLVVRPSISIVPAEVLAELDELAQGFLWKDHLLSTASFEIVLWRLFDDAGCAAFGRMPDAARGALARTLEEHAVAYGVLKTTVFADEPVKIRKKHVRGLLARRGSLEEPLPSTFADLCRKKGNDVAREGLCHALLGELHERWTDDAALAGALKEGLIAVARSVAATYRQEAFDPGTEAEEPALRAVRLAQFLQGRLVDAPLEMAVAIGIGGGQGLPRLSGGRLPDAEQRYRRAMRRMAGSARAVSGAEERDIELRPLSKAAALHRGELGRDCSSRYVPFRALSPHHVYYGLFEGGEQRPGYIGLFEAWAELPSGKRAAVLCLETINVPQRPPDAALQDIVRILESIATSRGLHPGLVLVTGIGTWNYQSGPLLETSRRFRRGAPVTLHPADPVTWRLYSTLAREARDYNAFSRAREGTFRMLAPFDADLDFIQPENAEEAARIRASAERELIVTARTADGPVGFISGWPEIL